MLGVAPDHRGAPGKPGLSATMGLRRCHWVLAAGDFSGAIRSRGERIPGVDFAGPSDGARLVRGGPGATDRYREGGRPRAESGPKSGGGRQAHIKAGRGRGAAPRYGGRRTPGHPSVRMPGSRPWAAGSASRGGGAVCWG